jgi:hypothetical protein
VWQSGPVVKGGEKRQWSIEHGLRVADREIERFRSVVDARNFTRLVPLNARTFFADIEGGQCIFRVPGRLSAETCERHANAFHRLARAVSADRISSPAARVRLRGLNSVLPANTEVVATERAPSTYIDGDRIDRDAMQRVGPEPRHLGAFLSYIAHLADHGSERNLLFSIRPAQFPFWFVDLDFAFGDIMPWGYGRALFYPGHRLDYHVGGYRAQLPPLAAELLAWVAGLRTSAIAHSLGLSLTEATDLHLRCAKAGDIGLAAAIDAERFWQRGRGLLARLGGRARAEAEKCLIACRALRRWPLREDS